jgi:hypothetical protein
VYKKPQSETGNQRLGEFDKTRSTKRTKCSRAEERTKDTCSQKEQQGRLSPQLPTPPAHPATTDQSDAVLHNLPFETVSRGMPPGHEGSCCLTRQEQVASYSRALVVTAFTATTLRAALLLRHGTFMQCHTVSSGSVIEY